MSETKPLLKALNVANIVNQIILRLGFTGEWFDAFKDPQDRGVWFIWGGSGSGKSTFVMQLCKVMAQLNLKVFMNIMEEEVDDSDFVDRVKLLEMHEVATNFLARSYEYDDLVKYLKRKNSPKVIVIDSATYFFSSLDQYKEFKKMFRSKIIIITGHANGKLPKFALEDSIRYDAKMKIFVDGFLALCQGRTIGANGGRFIIWQEGYNKIHGNNNE